MRIRLLGFYFGAGSMYCVTSCYFSEDGCVFLLSENLGSPCDLRAGNVLEQENIILQVTSHAGVVGAALCRNLDNFLPVVFASGEPPRRNVVVWER